jgi:sialate O-acetylesterase
MRRVSDLLSALIAFVLACVCAPAFADEPLLHPMFQDHAVLQRDQPIRVWGHAPAGERVTVTLARRSVTARANAAGEWSARLPRMSAGGPYVLQARVRGGPEQSASDVMIGDVFLCSGQSNMELQVARTLNSGFEIANGANPNIRMLRVQQDSAAAPAAAFLRPVQWEAASPTTVGNWSAACYYFARELRRTIDVPMGLINASWGGSNIRAWMSADAVRRVGGFDAQLDLLDLKATNPSAAIARWGETWESWWMGAVPTPAGSEPWNPDYQPDWPTAPATLDVWNVWGVPALANFTGLVWHRASVRLTPAQAAQAATLSLGVIDEGDHTWLNGTLVGATGDWNAHRRYPVQAGALRAGENVVVINVVNTSGQGGMRGPVNEIALELADGERIPLGPWQYEAAPRNAGFPPRAPWEAITGLGTLYNGMLSPIGRYNLRGALWYQGESNAGEPGTYQALMTGLMADWRARFGADLPFLIVQLPNYGARVSAPAESGWAGVREAQRRAVAGDAHAGLAVTIDLGDPNELHPPNKQDIGRRLARAARHVIYGEAIAPSGAMPASARRSGEDVVVEFASVEGQLITYGADGPIGFELCGDAVGSCQYAAARLDGARVHLARTGMGQATRVRFCWADSPTCTLYDGSGLPVGPFEFPVQ